MASTDDSYQITGNVCPPKLPMDFATIADSQPLSTDLLHLMLSEQTVQESKTRSSSHSVCALSSLAKVSLNKDGLSHLSVVNIPYFFCNFCDYHTDNKEALLRHVASSHMFRCKLCHHISYTRYGLAQHQLNKHLDAEEIEPLFNSKAVNLSFQQMRSTFFDSGSSVLASTSVSSQSNNNHPMPHFLDDSDPAITSSNSPPRELSPVSIQISEVHSAQNLQHLDSDESSRDERPIPSFLVDPLFSPESVELLNSAPEKGKKSSKTGKLPLENKERCSSPTLSLLSGERLQKQLEEAMSKSPGFSFLATSDDACPKNETDYADLPKASGFHSSATDILEPQQTAGNDEIQIKQECFFKSEIKEEPMELGTFDQGEHFLTSLIPLDDMAKNGAEEGFEECSSNFSSNSETLQKPAVPDDSNYLLRKLLVKNGNRSTDKDSSGCLNEIGGSNKFGEGSIEKYNKLTESMPLSSPKENSPVSRPTRPSDMTLKDLLTSGLPPKLDATSAFEKEDRGSIFFDCGYCYFETNDRILFQAHVEKCKASNSGLMPLNVEGKSSHRHRASLGKTGWDDDDDNDIIVINDEDTDNNLVKDVEGIHSHYSASEALKFMSHQYTKQSNKTSTHSKNIVSQRQKSVWSQSKSGRMNVDMEEMNDSYAIDSDSSLDSDDGTHNLKSDPDYKPNNLRSIKTGQGKRTRRSSASQVPSLSPLLKHNISYGKQQPKLRFSCMQCVFSSLDRCKIREHVLYNHESSLPFAITIFTSGGQCLTYFCKGPSSTCKFLSCEGTEIIEHIKLCYFGHLDNFLSTGVSSQDYSRILASIEMALKIQGQKSPQFYCLRCNFVSSSISNISAHASTFHSKEVIGIFMFDTSFVEENKPRSLAVRMLCLHCGAFVHVRQWWLHPCRMASYQDDMNKTLSSKDLGSIEDASDIGQHSYTDVKSDQIESEENKESPSNPDQDYSSSSQCQKVFGGITVTNSADKPESVSNIVVKTETEEKENSGDELTDDMPIHFSQDNGQNEDLLCLNSGTDRPHNESELSNWKAHTEIAQLLKEKVMRSKRSKSKAVSQPLRQKRLKTSSNPSVLHNLLTSPSQKAMSKSSSVLENILLGPKTATEVELLQQPASSDSRKHVSMTSSGHTQWQYSSLLERLSTERAPSRVSDPQLLDQFNKTPTRSPVLQTALNSPSLTLTHAAFSSPSLDSLGPSPISNPGSSPLSVIVAENAMKLYPVPEPSPPLIPQPPSLPLLPPLSPSPPLQQLEPQVQNSPKDNSIETLGGSLLQGLLTGSLKTTST